LAYIATCLPRVRTSQTRGESAGLTFVM